MAKEKTIFVCSNCGYESMKWLGKCPDCNSWNTFTEELKKSSTASVMKKSTGISSKNKPKKLDEIESSKTKRLNTKIDELNRVLGGGLVAGSLTLISGDPGIGKSTLLLQTAGSISETYGKVLYVSGEESEEQIKMRADRLQVKSKELYLVSETNLIKVEEHIKEINPVFVIIDSIQTIFSENVTSAPGFVSQVRECTNELMRIGKTLSIPLFIVAHVTKSGELAGPRVLEHMVDTVLYFEGQRTEDIRILRTIKNRFGTTSEIGVFEMEELGLIEVNDSSKLFIEDEAKTTEGTMIVGVMEGTRPVLVQLQSLVQETKIVMPRRTGVGIDIPRLNMILAVIEKKLRIPFYSSDVYVNVVGGLNVNGTSQDLGLAIALISSIKGKELGLKKAIAIGEIGLTGEIRPVNFIERIVNEAKKLGFENVIIPKRNSLKKKPVGINIIEVDNLKEMYDKLFR